jgi:hypothetical protein
VSLLCPRRPLAVGLRRSYRDAVHDPFAPFTSTSEIVAQAPAAVFSDGFAVAPFAQRRIDVGERENGSANPAPSTDQNRKRRPKRADAGDCLTLVFL